MVKRAVAYVSSKNLATKTEVWLKQAILAAGGRVRLKINPAVCALLIIDAQRYFIEPQSRAFQPAADVVVPKIGEILAAWRRAGLKVAFTRHGHTGPEDLGMLGEFFNDFIRADSAEAEIASALSPQSSEPVFNKTTYDAFWKTSLADWLMQHNLSQILVAGMLTQLCCETTVRSAFVRGFMPFVLADGTLTSTEELHLGSLLGLASGVAGILSVEQVVAACQIGR